MLNCVKFDLVLKRRIWYSILRNLVLNSKSDLATLAWFALVGAGSLLQPAFMNPLDNSCQHNKRECAGPLASAAAPPPLIGSRRHPPYSLHFPSKSQYDFEIHFLRLIHPL